MQVTSLLSRHEHDHDHKHDQNDPSCSACGDHEHAPVHLWQTLAGVVFVLNAFFLDWFFEKSQTISSASACIGAIILGYPIVWTAIKDIYRGILSINELVAIAVLAAFASGDYKTAGVVAFFMLMGEIIETRTAEGARASIESLIKLTPTKARRITPQGEEEVAASNLAIGDVIRIRPGDNVAADGVIVTDKAPLTRPPSPANLSRLIKNPATTSSPALKTSPASSKSKSAAPVRTPLSAASANSSWPPKRPSCPS